MTQTSNRLFDELARLMTDAGNVAQGVRREASTAFRSQADRLVTELDLVRREDFEAVREMASRARAENERLAERVAALEAQLGTVAGARGTTAPTSDDAGATTPRNETPGGE
jgi:BMFP domain-containing protein YqiC